jgi:hypothetical protein
MAKPEQRLTNRMRRQFKLGENLLVKNVEHAFEAGWPDTLVLARATQRVTFFEYKVAAWPKRKDGRLQYSHPPTIDQINWHLEWSQWGGSSFYLIRVLNVLFAVPGKIGDNVLQLRVDDMPQYRKDYAALRSLCEYGT